MAIAMDIELFLLAIDRDGMDIEHLDGGESLRQFDSSYSSRPLDLGILFMPDCTRLVFF